MIERFLKVEENTQIAPSNVALGDDTLQYTRAFRSQEHCRPHAYHSSPRGSRGEDGSHTPLRNCCAKRSLSHHSQRRYMQNPND